MTVQSGVWRHYKGPLYLVLGVAHDSNSDSLYVTENDGTDFTRLVASSDDPMAETVRLVVVYVALERGQERPADGRAHCRGLHGVGVHGDRASPLGGPPEDYLVCKGTRRFTYVGVGRP